MRIILSQKTSASAEQAIEINGIEAELYSKFLPMQTKYKDILANRMSVSIEHFMPSELVEWHDTLQIRANGLALECDPVELLTKGLMLFDTHIQRIQNLNLAVKRSMQLQSKLQMRFLKLKIINNKLPFNLKLNAEIMEDVEYKIDVLFDCIESLYSVIGSVKIQTDKVCNLEQEGKLLAEMLSTLDVELEGINANPLVVKIKLELGLIHQIFSLPTIKHSNDTSIQEEIICNLFMPSVELISKLQALDSTCSPDRKSNFDQTKMYKNSIKRINTLLQAPDLFSAKNKLELEVQLQRLYTYVSKMLLMLNTCISQELEKQIDSKSSIKQRRTARHITWMNKHQKSIDDANIMLYGEAKRPYALIAAQITSLRSVSPNFKLTK